MHTQLSSERFAGALRAGDSRRYGVDLRRDRKAVIDAAVTEAATGTGPLGPIHTSHIKGRLCRSVASYSHALIIRLLSKFYAKRFGVNTNSRDRVVKAVIESLGDATPMYLYRRDISSFYESISVDDVEARLSSTMFVPNIVLRCVKRYFETFCPKGTKGIPRGISLSAILAEVTMKDFDQSVRILPEVYRYFRYSDDILIFCREKSPQIDKKLASILPPGMHFNAAKSSSIEVFETEKDRAKLLCFEYLGYKYTFSNLCGKRDFRRVSVTISDKKILKFKSKIICSFKAFKKTPDFDLLRDRLRFLSGNYAVARTGVTAVKTSKFVKSGIYYNYKLCGSYKDGKQGKHQGHELIALDAFYHSLLNSGPDARSLNPMQKEILRRVSFYKGFLKKMTFKFRPSRIIDIKKGWRNV